MTGANEAPAPTQMESLIATLESVETALKCLLADKAQSSGEASALPLFDSNLRFVRDYLSI